MKTLIICCLTLFSTALSAQEINFCLNYTVLGEPIRVSNSWNINEDGGYLYVLYRQQTSITKNNYYVVISEERDGLFQEVDRQRIVPELGKNWAAVYYKFLKPGDFKVSVIENDQLHATEYLTILTQKVRKRGKRKIIKDPRLLYTNTKVIACETVKDGRAINPSAVFRITEQPTEVTFLIMNDKAISLEKLNIDIYKKAGPFDQYSQFVESKRISLMHDNTTYFNLQFLEPGDYKVYIYDQDQVWINSGYVTINSN